MVVLIYQSITVGFAYKPQEMGMGSIAFPDDSYEVDVDFHLYEIDPSLVDKVFLEVSKSDQVAFLATVAISLDDGRSWIYCDHIEGKSWECLFPNEFFPEVEDIYSIEVVVKS
jgi:hypothetical protein